MSIHGLSVKAIASAFKTAMNKDTSKNHTVGLGRWTLDHDDKFIQNKGSYDHGI